jgi:hypothetical protein
MTAALSGRAALDRHGRGQAFKSPTAHGIAQGHERVSASDPYRVRATWEHQGKLRVWLPAVPGAVKATPHDLRHFYASLISAKGASVVQVSRRLGHARVSITLDTYAHLIDLEPDADPITNALDVVAAARGARRPRRLVALISRLGADRPVHRRRLHHVETTQLRSHHQRAPRSRR